MYSYENTNEQKFFTVVIRMSIGSHLYQASIDASKRLKNTILVFGRLQLMNIGIKQPIEIKNNKARHKTWIVNTARWPLSVLIHKPRNLGYNPDW